MKHELACAAAVAVLFLAGCHSQRQEPWQDAKVAAPLQIPAGLDHPGTADALTVPDTADESAGTQAVSPLPPTSINIDATESVDATWQRVAAELAAGGVGTAEGRDDARHHVTMAFRLPELALPKHNFVYRMFHDSPDPKRTYRAKVDVVEENGQVQVQIDGDGLAVSRVDGLLQGKVK